MDAAKIVGEVAASSETAQQELQADASSTTSHAQEQISSFSEGDLKRASMWLTGREDFGASGSGGCSPAT